MADKPRDVELIFHDARQIRDPAQRSSYLTQACGGDSALRSRVENLLAADAELGSFLRSTDETLEFPSRARGSSPSPMTTVADPLSEKPGTIIGRYKLLQQIGEGGFGVVYMAEQREPVQRKVAFKIIKLGMDTRDVIARFEQERQALAMMDHTNIAKVLDAGATGTGRPYFVMELVKGIPITDYCDKQNMSFRDRLALFIQVCGAVQHAHQKGIIHRDIKPSNVLVTHVDDKPVPKVIDFGIAKATQQKLTEHTMFTQLGQFMGTPAYMSPEQADPLGLDIDTRSDIYSLGVLLYELLTGATPFDDKTLRRAGLDEIKRIIREDEPPRPSTRLSSLGAELDTVARQRAIDPKRLSSLLRGDLDWIIMKALEKDRTRRYETANGFAVDIQRYLSGEPVSAAPPSAAYRMRKFVRRNRSAVTGAASIGLVLVAATAVSTWFGLREAAARGRESEQRILAEKRAEETRRVADFQSRMLSEIDTEAMGRGIKDRLRAQVRATLERQYLGVYPDRRKRTPTEVDAELAAYDERADVAQAVDVARHVMDEFLLKRAAEASQKEFDGQPLVQAQIHDAIGTAYQSLGLYEAAEPHLRAALQLRRQELGPEHELVATSMNKLGELLYTRGDLSGAEALFRDTLTVRRKLFGEEHADVASSMFDMAKIHRMRRNHAAAETLYRDALAMSRRTRGEEHTDVAYGLNNLAKLLEDKEDYAAAEPLFRQALAMHGKLRGEDDRGTATILNNLGGLLQRKGDHVAAEAVQRETLATRRRLLGDEHPAVATALGDLGGVLSEKGDFDAAESAFREALEINRKLLGDESGEVALGLQDLAVVRRRRGDLAAAEPLFREALALERKVFGDESSQVANTMNSLGVLLEAKKEYAAAEPLFRESLAIRRKIPGRQQEAIGNSLHNLANLLRATGNYADAEPLYRESLAKKQQVLGDSHLETLYPKVGLAETLAELHRFSEAETFLLDAVKHCEQDEIKRRRHWPTIVNTAVKLYEAWDAAEPGQGHDAKAAKWRGESPLQTNKESS